ncbi:MAG: ankyrin repeat domain-containing protein [Emticicia sp.]|nr:ankyrin repeat domain-containing protein [Emticicia sp.]
MKNKLILTLLFGMMSVSLIAQNVFLEKDFWTKKPSIELIKQKMAEGNNLFELKPGGFDGPMWAIMEDCDFATIKFIFDLPGADVSHSLLHHGNNYLMWTAYKGNLPVMKLLLDKGSKTDIINAHGQSLLMHVAMSGKADPVLYDFCIQNGADIKNDRDTDGRSAMLTAAASLKDAAFVKYFLDKGLSIKDIDNKGNGLFHHAVSGGNIQVLKDLVAMGVSTAPNKAGENAFAFVGRNRTGKIEMDLLTYLKSLGLDPTTKFANGQTLVHTAARSAVPDEKVLAFLTENKLNFSQADNEGNTPLILTSARGNVASVAYWIEKNEINAINKTGLSALNQAIAYNSAEVVKLLMSKGADVNHKDKDGNDAYYSLINGYRKGKNSMQRVTDIMEVLKVAGINMPKTGKLLHTALDKDDNELFSKLLEMGEDINAKDRDGYTVLHYAGMKSKNLDLIKFLVEKGANPTIKTELNEGVLDLIAENEVLGKQNLNLKFLTNE